MMGATLRPIEAGESGDGPASRGSTGGAAT